MRIFTRSAIFGLVLLIVYANTLFASSIIVSDGFGSPGDTAILITVSLSNTDSYAGSEFELQYNSTLLDLNRIEAASRLSSQSGTGFYEFTTGKVSFIFFDFDGQSLPADSGEIFNVYFDISSEIHQSQTEITISEVTAVSDDLEYDSVTVKNGSITFTGYCGDVNNDSAVDFTDILYLIDYIFRGGPPPCQPVLGLFAEESSASGAELAVYAKDQDDKSVTVVIDGKFVVDLFGAQIDFEWNRDKLELTNILQTTRTEKVGLYHNHGKDEKLKTGLVDIKGKENISAGEGPLLELLFRVTGDSLDLSSLEITEATLVDLNVQKLPVKIINKVGTPVLPKEFSVSQNYPNPFNPNTIIEYALPRDCRVKIAVYNVLGQRVKTLIDKHQRAGYQRVEWNSKNDQGKEVASGIYFYRIQADQFNKVKKMVIIK